MVNKKKIYVFDFDGTLTLKDSMMSVIIYQRGWIGLIWALLRQIHLIVLMFLGKYPNQKAKEHLLGYCFGGMTESELNTLFSDFAVKYKSILNPETMSKLNDALREKDAHVYVITASPRLWVEKFFTPNHSPLTTNPSSLTPNLSILGTELEIGSNGFTGYFTSPNCYGQEKVNRLVQNLPSLINHREDYYIISYGDSRGDREMFDYSDEYILIK